MTKQQFWILNIIGGLAALMILGNLVFGYTNRAMTQKVQQDQAALGSIPAFEKVAQNLILRLATASRNDKAIQDLLAKHKMEVKFQDTPSTQ